MSYLSVFDISASGMSVEKSRLEFVAKNLANANSTRPAGETPYTAERLISGPSQGVSFSDVIDQAAVGRLSGVQQTSVKHSSDEFRLSYEPNHPHANSDGFVTYGNVDLLTEMMEMVRSVRAYEANVKAVNAYKAMVQQALEIGE